MTRKVIQVISHEGSLLALCDDGSLWMQSRDGWHQMAVPPSQT
jgi:hypothetical protein